MVDESTLLDAARRFDAEALTSIFDLYAPLLYKYGIRLCHDETEADNVVGDVFAQLLEHLAAGKGPRSNLRAYLYQIAYHLVVNQVRYSNRVTPLEGDIELEDRKRSVHAEIEDIELREALRSALDNELSTDQRHVIVLRFLEGFNIEETAEITGKSIGSVKVLQNRAIKKLQQVLNKKLLASIDVGA